MLEALNPVRRSRQGLDGSVAIRQRRLPNAADSDD